MQNNGAIVKIYRLIIFLLSMLIAYVTPLGKL